MEGKGRKGENGGERKRGEGEESGVNGEGEWKDGKRRKGRKWKNSI